MTTRVVILAAGKGTRMRSRLPKILHPLGGMPMVQHALDAARQASPLPPVLVIGHGAAAIRAAIGDQAEYVEQHEQNGTGHAVMQAQAALEGKAEQVIVSNADLPLLTGQTLAALAEAHAKSKAAITLLTLKQKNARGFGRIKRLKGKPVAIIEEAEATPKQLLIEELNVGAYCFNAKWLWAALSKLKPSAKKGEYYLTDLLAIAVKQNKKIHSLELQDPTEAIGINTREHLAEAEFALRQRINRHWMLAGVTIQDPLTTYIEPGVTLGQDTTILPNTMLLAGTQVGEDCIIGPNTSISHSRVGNGCHIQAAVVEHAVIENDVEIGPFAHLRKGAHLEDGVHMGNFGEIKNSRLAPGVKMGHFSYIGDATIGKDVNIGAGTITANYDGKNKNPTVIEDGVFIGSDTMLVAPLHIGKGARTGAGAVVTKDVPPHTVVAGVPARAIRKLEGSD
ncbi:MAG: bifunctional UDP-N-acetylglucosamine diphosphorylase/glucosamine-1-phosphate N-acetyltransferase GlmU [Anaerolineales bacterium]|nr:MAG: bifunctional UDP-N-acetylglucosamine diphosphorylase/glucosamine-1-phosphate N-acetyltransferase GlmU [Anaerolineales bacterium]